LKNRNLIVELIDRFVNENSNHISGEDIMNLESKIVQNVKNEGSGKKMNVPDARNPETDKVIRFSLK